MVTVLRGDGFRVVIYPNDHRPAHVHVIGAEHEAVFNLNCPAGPRTCGRIMVSRPQVSGRSRCF